MAISFVFGAAIEVPVRAKNKKLPIIETQGLNIPKTFIYRLIAFIGVTIVV